MADTSGTKIASTPRPRGQGPVPREIPRIARQILLRPELKRVHEDAQDHHLRPAACLVHQRQVTLVEIAHGGYQADAAPGGALGPGPGAEFGNGGELEHG